MEWIDTWIHTRQSQNGRSVSVQYSMTDCLLLGRCSRMDCFFCSDRRIKQWCFPLIMNEQNKSTWIAFGALFLIRHFLQMWLSLVWQQDVTWLLHDGLIDLAILGLATQSSQFHAIVEQSSRNVDLLFDDIFFSMHYVECWLHACSFWWKILSFVSFLYEFGWQQAMVSNVSLFCNICKMTMSSKMMLFLM